MLKLYGFSKVNATARGHTRDLRVLWALEEMQMPFEIVGLDHPAHELNSDSYRRLSPFEQIPAIDDEGVVISESAAIVVYLAKKTATLIPPDLAGEAQVLRWSFAAMNSVEMPLMSLVVLDWNGGKEAGCKKARNGFVDWSKLQLKGLNTWLEGREFIATDAFTVADILMAHVLSAVPDDLLGQNGNVQSYRERCLQRPAWRRALQHYCDRVEAA